ncbi:HD domain-containing protein [Actinomadura sp. NAK00032]|uniref:HD domain-containing protein n=1 Tax=Actinomadura sp. NAK00032 TaxID=2742128 RepID=UPI00158FAF5A|nr:HD domain-containing protein [Actinomadura sp. NAK00032]QKW34395.1 HD domain-containing protein [Actinomadura sp. NAK00032]
MNKTDVIERTAEYARKTLEADSSGHDWWHVARVRRLALELAREERADLYVVELAALLHDISDYKLNGGDLTKGPRRAFEWLVGLGEPEGVAQDVADIIAAMSFKGAGTASEMATIEGKVVQDADRLDALGAIGAARAFAYGGYKGEPMHVPGLSPHLHTSLDDYLNREGSTINHFYEKLLLLKDRMNTEGGRRLAERRHRVLERFLDDFLTEWDAKDIG